MREIKFRAWDNLNKYMGDVMQYLPYAGRIGTVKIQHNGGQSYMCDEFELMQFTGLLDKNGKEIFESDILQYINNEGKLTDIYFVEWNKRGFIGRWSKRKEGEFNNCDGLDCPEKDMEIIGNIYENPELLGNKHK